MADGLDLSEAYFDAVRRDDVQKVRCLLQEHPELVNARWKG